MTPVKNQLKCGSCWAFSTICELENAVLNMDRNYLSEFWLNEINKTLDLSEIFVVANIHGFNKGCSGGDSSSALNWFLAKNMSVETESDYNYENLYPNYLKNTTYKELPYKINTTEDHLQPI